MKDKQVIELLDSMTARLGEHFEAVQIMVSWTDNGGTSMVTRGLGNHYARQGMARDFLTTDQSRTAADELSRALKDDEQ